MTGIALQLVVILQPLRHFKTGNLGQLNVHQDEVGPVLARQFDRLDAAARLHDTVPAGLDEVVEQFHVQLIVLDNEHGLGHRAFHGG